MLASISYTLLLGSLSSVEPAMVILWSGLVIFLIALLVVIYGRWGQSRPLRKCLILSFLAHLLLLVYAATVEITVNRNHSREEIVRITFASDEESSNSAGSVPLEKQNVVSGKVPQVVEVRPQTEIRFLESADKKNVPASSVPEATLFQPLISVEESAAVRSRQSSPAEISMSTDGTVDKKVEIKFTSSLKPSVPEAYRLRFVPNRDELVVSRGGSVGTEAAVKAALKWLADNQSADGSWNPRLHGAGREGYVSGKNHYGAGSRADTGITALALLSFMGAGHTHLNGPYKSDIRRGLDFLIRHQAPDGNLAGNAAMFEFMYCHGMATCALSEAYGLTGDPALFEPVRRAIDYTIRAQDPVGGGWRYRPGEAGDTSQLGWQLMALKSAELAGIAIPETTRQGIIRYLRSVASGRYGGLASYRRGERPSRTMTAEALVCWQFLGLPRENPACDEAGDYLLEELPGVGEYNLYYWYYATLAMFQLQGEYWNRWNEALRTHIVKYQVKSGPLAGSWDINDLWGCHGGRVYTTAMATLTLEVYYRFLPIYCIAEKNAGRVK